jgi:kynureninase
MVLCALDIGKMAKEMVKEKSLTMTDLLIKLNGDKIL